MVAKAKQRKEENGVKVNPMLTYVMVGLSIILLVVAQFAEWVDLTTAAGIAASMSYLIPGITFVYLLNKYHHGRISFI